ncbi:MAG: hypothetical protein ACJ752_04140 [Gaiellaceae bacterium]
MSTNGTNDPFQRAIHEITAHRDRVAEFITKDGNGELMAITALVSRLANRGVEEEGWPETAKGALDWALDRGIGRASELFTVGSGRLWKSSQKTLSPPYAQPCHQPTRA